MLNPSEDIAQDHPVRIVDAIVESFDLQYFKKLYHERGRSAYHPKMMLKVILYAYMNNIYSCRKIERQFRLDIHFIWLAAQDRPDFVTINRFHLEQRPRYKPNPFHQDNFHYNADGDYFVCPMGQHRTHIGIARSKTASVYRSESARYRARNCKGCPLRCLCYKARGDRRIIEVNHRLNRYKRKARELLTSEEGIRHRCRRCIEPEAVFGQMKANMAYRRFRHFGNDKVTMDFAFFAIAFNIKKTCYRKKRQLAGETRHFL